MVTWTKVNGDRYQRLVVTTKATGLRPLEQPAAYKSVPRLQLTRSGTIEGLGAAGDVAEDAAGHDAPASADTPTSKQPEASQPEGPALR